MELVYRFLLLSAIFASFTSSSPSLCSMHGLKYLQGDALTDSKECISEKSGKSYPHEAIADLHKSQLRQHLRSGRTLFDTKAQSPELTRRELLEAHSFMREGRSEEYFHMMQARKKREVEGPGLPVQFNATEAPKEPTCGETPARLCKSAFNTTAPMFGISLTSGKPVTIVQIFPDLLQQVVYETCSSKECDLVHGDCVQTYIPYLFLVIPLGPVTLTGQDYVLVESGCSCRPKYAKPGTDPNPTSIIPSF